jgi:hypothetical protein
MTHRPLPMLLDSIEPPKENEMKDKTPKTPKRPALSELEALMRNYTEYQRDLPPWARGPG